MAKADNEGSNKDQKAQHKQALKDRKEAKSAEKKDRSTKTLDEGKQPLLDNPDDSSPAKNSEKDATVKGQLCLKDIGIKVFKGEFVCVIGDVGSGKSSLL